MIFKGCIFWSATCKGTTTIRSASFFQRSHLPLRTIFELWYHWSFQEDSLRKISNRLRLDSRSLKKLLQAIYAQLKSGKDRRDIYINLSAVVSNFKVEFNWKTSLQLKSLVLLKKCLSIETSHFNWSDFNSRRIS